MTIPQPVTNVPEIPRRSSDIGSLAGSAAKLLGSGVVSALALTIVTSNRWNLLDPGVGVTLVLFLQWQILGLTLTKMGIDQIIFAAVTENPRQRPTARAHMLRRALPLGVLFSVLVAVVFGPWYGLACLCSLVLDTHAILLLADLNARERYTEVMFASLLNYPLFFLLVFGLQAAWRPVTTGIVLVLFVLTSVTRWVWLTFHRSAPSTFQIISYQGTALTGAVPLLNFLMFRVDQVLLGTTFVTTLVATVRSDFARQLLFLGRYQEVLAGGLAMLTGLVYPRLYIKYPFTVRTLLTTAARRWWVVGAYILAVGGSLAAYSLLWRGSPLLPILLASGALSALLILPANVLTYSMIRQDHVRGLVRSLAVVVAAGLGTIAVSYLFAAPMIFVVAVPLQLAAFVLLALSRHWTRQARPA